MYDILKRYAFIKPTTIIAMEEPAVPVDTTPPVSSVDAIENYWRNSSPFTVTATASDSSGVNNVELWYRYSSNNSTWGGWTLFGTNSSGSYSWAFDAPSGDGFYEFYSIATDAVGNREAPPAEADAQAGVDRVAPSSYGYSVSLPLLLPPTFHVKLNASDELSGVYGAGLYYRYSRDDVTWSDWKETEIVPLGAILQWGHGFPLHPEEGIGLYQFYTVAKDFAGNVEEAPRDQAGNAMADAGWDADVYKVAYIPVRYVGNPGPERTVAELKQRAELVREYYWQQSFGKAVIVDNWIFDDWRSLGKTLQQYPPEIETKYEGGRWEAVFNDAADLAENRTEYRAWKFSATVVIQPEPMKAAWSAVIVADDHSFSIWAHELGHRLFWWNDYYSYPGIETYGDIHNWGLMGSGARMNPPSAVMSYNKATTSYNKRSWLNYTNVTSEAYGDYQIKLVESQRYGDDVFRYVTEQGNTEYFIFEGRQPPDDVFLRDSWRDEGYHLSSDEGVLIYKVVESGGKEYVYTVPHEKAWYEFWVDEHATATLLPGESYKDEDARVQFTVQESSYPYLNLNISRYVPERRMGVRLITPVCPPNIPTWSAVSPAENSYFDVDLHIYTRDGKHVGPIYENENILYEIGIENATTSRNILGGGPEWIFLPDNVEFYAFVDPTPAKKWAQELGLPIENVVIPVTVDVVHYDENGTGQESKPVTLAVSLTEPTQLAVPATVDVDPDTLNLKSKGSWITAYIELPEGYALENIDKSTITLAAVDNVRLTQSVPAVSEPSGIGDHDGDGVPDLMVKFNRSTVQSLLKPGETKLTVQGKFIDRLPFEGGDTIRVR